jgi:hypothetical protein
MEARVVPLGVCGAPRESPRLRGEILLATVRLLVLALYRTKTHRTPLDGEGRLVPVQTVHSPQPHGRVQIMDVVVLGDQIPQGTIPIPGILGNASK